MDDYALARLQQAVERMILIATVVERDGDKAKVEWAEGVQSDWLKIAQLGSEELKLWIPPNPGTQVVVFSPGGDTTKGVIFPGPFAGAVPAGNLAGHLTGTGDITVEGISHVNHTHGGILAGPSSTDPPQ